MYLSIHDETSIILTIKRMSSNILRIKLGSGNYVLCEGSSSLLDKITGEIFLHGHHDGVVFLEELIKEPPYSKLHVSLLDNSLSLIHEF